MAKHLENLDLVWHPGHGVRIVVELEEDTLPERLQRAITRYRREQGPGVFTYPVDAELEINDDEDYFVSGELLRWYGEHHLARVGYDQ